MYSGCPHIRFPFLGGMVPLDLRFRGPLEAESFVRGRKIDPPGAPGRVFDLKCASCGHVRRCIRTSQTQPMTSGMHAAAVNLDRPAREIRESVARSHRLQAFTSDGCQGEGHYPRMVAKGKGKGCGPWGLAVAGGPETCTAVSSGVVGRGTYRSLVAGVAAPAAGIPLGRLPRGRALPSDGCQG